MRTVEVQWLYETTTRYGTWSPRISVRIEVQEDLQLVAGSGLVNQAGDELLDFVAQFLVLVFELRFHVAQTLQFFG